MNINQILKGIDKTQTEDTEGWWETIVGAEFGAAETNRTSDSLLRRRLAAPYIRC